MGEALHAHGAKRSARAILLRELGAEQLVVGRFVRSRSVEKIDQPVENGASDRRR